MNVQMLWNMFVYKQLKQSYTMVLPSPSSSMCRFSAECLRHICQRHYEPGAFVATKLVPLKTRVVCVVKSLIGHIENGAVDF